MAKYNKSKIQKLVRQAGGGEEGFAKIIPRSSDGWVLLSEKKERRWEKMAGIKSK